MTDEQIKNMNVDDRTALLLKLAKACLGNQDVISVLDERIVVFVVSPALRPWAMGELFKLTPIVSGANIDPFAGE